MGIPLKLSHREGEGAIDKTEEMYRIGVGRSDAVDEKRAREGGLVGVQTCSRTVAAATTRSITWFRNPVVAVRRLALQECAFRAFHQERLAQLPVPTNSQRLLPA